MRFFRSLQPRLALEAEMRNTILVLNFDVYGDRQHRNVVAGDGEGVRGLELTGAFSSGPAPTAHSADHSADQPAAKRPRRRWSEACPVANATKSLAASYCRFTAARTGMRRILRGPSPSGAVGIL